MRVQWLDRAFKTVLFYFGWIICLNQTAVESTFLGLALIGAILAYYFYTSVARRATSLLLILTLFIGPLSDSVYTHLGLLEYHGPQAVSWLPPLWSFSLWGLFSVNIPLFHWLKRHPVLAILMGAIGGPMSYLSVVHLGGASFPKPLPLTCVTIGGMWAVLLPSFIWLNDWINKRFKRSFSS